MLKYPRMRGLKTAGKTSCVDQHSVSRVKVAFQPITWHLGLAHRWIWDTG